MIDTQANKNAIKKLYNIDINSPAFPAYKKMIMDYCETFNYILSIIRKKENQKYN